jgi:hypothetical protein
MHVKVDHEKLRTAATQLEALADRVDGQRNLAHLGTPIDTPSLAGHRLGAKTAWMRDQLPMLQGLSAIAWLLDTKGAGTSEFDVGNDPIDVLKKLGDMLANQAATAEFLNLYGRNDGFPLVPLALAAGKMTRMANGTMPIFQTGLVGKKLLPLLERAPGGLGTLGTWMRSPAGELFTKRLGIVGGIYGTGAGLYDLYTQGNPIDAFKKDKAGYVADVAKTTFTASTTAFLVAPNPVTGAIAVGSGLVWGGAEVVDHWDGITDGASDAWNSTADAASDAWDSTTGVVSDVGGAVGGLFS